MMQMSKEYAEALFMLACEENKKQEYADSLAVVTDILENNTEYIDFLSSPAIPVGERVEAIDSAFSGELPEHIVSFLKLLCERSRIRMFEECTAEYNKLLKVSQQISTAKVTSAVEITEEEEKNLIQKLEKMFGHAVKLEKAIDPSIIGGMIIESDGKVVDASLRRRLSDVKEVISR